MIMGISDTIKVTVQSNYNEPQSDPENGQYFFSYTVTIVNNGNLNAKLQSRHWIISDSNGRVQEVRGDGVVGEQPELAPGEGFRYTSGTILETPVGDMNGSYQMIADDGVEFDAEIPTFVLSMPNTLH